MLTIWAAGHKRVWRQAPLRQQRIRVHPRLHLNNQFAFADEVTIFHGNFGESRSSLGSGQVEARLKTVKDEPGKRGARRGVPHYVYDPISRWVVYHFHDTSLSAGIRRQGPINDNEVLRPTAQNLAAFLFRRPKPTLKNTSKSAMSSVSPRRSSMTSNSARSRRIPR